MSEKNNDQQLEKILHSIAQDAKADKNFEQMLKVKLRERFHLQHEAPKEEQKKTFLKRIWRFKTQFASAFILVLFSSTTLYAYNSDEVTNGSILYPLKRSTENVEELFATTPEAKTEHYSKMAKRRMRELAVLQVKGITDETTIKETNALLRKASTIALEVADEPIESNERETQERKTDERKLNERKTDERKTNERKTDEKIKQRPVEINLAQERTPDKDPNADATRTPLQRTKRTKALEEISEIREEFEEKFERKEREPIIKEIERPKERPVEIKLIRDEQAKESNRPTDRKEEKRLEKRLEKNDSKG